MDSSDLSSSSSGISMNDFLEFLKITCQVNDSFCNNNSRNITGKDTVIDYNKLANNEIINSLMFKEKPNEQKRNSLENSCITNLPGDSNESGSKNENRNDQGGSTKSNTLQSNSTSSLGKKKSSTTLQGKLIKTNESPPGVSDNLQGKKCNINPILASKLDEVINEGILDAVLPFICPPMNSISSISSNSNQDITLISNSSKSSKSKVTNSELNSNINISNSNTNNFLKPTPPPPPPTAKPSSTSIKEKLDSPSMLEEKDTRSENSRSPRNGENSIRIRESSKNGRRKSIIPSNRISSEDHNRKSDAEVIIHVCDEVKNTSKDFSCPQNLLVSKMGYFADVTAGQRLEDMDISVHCDIQIFEWLIKWVKKNPNQPDQWPQLDATNVVPILVSASFLQMEPLLLDCLAFCHSRLNEVVRTSTNLSCLNDSIITRLAAMFTNLELEMVKDKKERVTPRLWIKLIQSLFEPEPQALRGHYFSLIGLFRCNKCGKYLTQSSCSYVTCIPQNNRLNRWGQLVSQHTRDSSWQITNYVSTLFKELKSWRKVYWKLWGHCHHLYCGICESYFPAYQMNWCYYHPEAPQFLGPITEGRIAGPTGRYPCCGQQAFRYETLPGPNGCQYREHSVQVESDKDRAILTLAQVAAEGGCLYDPSPKKSPAHMEPKWVGMALMPTKCRQGLLPILHADESNNKNTRRMRQGTVYFVDSSSDSDSSDSNERKYHQLSYSSDGCESETNSPRNYKRSKDRRQIRPSGRYWSGEMSARSNQDNQREFEERIMKQIVSMVNKKAGGNMETTVQQNTSYNGGTYLRLESEWKEQIKLKNLNKSKLK